MAPSYRKAWGHSCSTILCDLWTTFNPKILLIAALREGEAVLWAAVAQLVGGAHAEGQHGRPHLRGARGRHFAGGVLPEGQHARADLLPGRLQTPQLSRGQSECTSYNPHWLFISLQAMWSALYYITKFKIWITLQSGLMNLGDIYFLALLYSVTLVVWHKVLLTYSVSQSSWH